MNKTPKLSPKIAIVICVYNEFENIKVLLPKFPSLLEGYNYKVIVVDDGSTDGLAKQKENLKDKNTVFVTHKDNYGITAVFNSGIKKAGEFLDENDILVIMEGDGTSDPELVPDLCKCVTDNYDVAIASRFSSGGGYHHFPWHRKIFSEILNNYLALNFKSKKSKINDYTIFFRGYRFGFIRKIFDDNRRYLSNMKNFTINTAIILLAIKQGANVLEIPYVYDYSHKESKSKLNVLSSIITYVKLVMEFRGNRFYKHTRVQETT